MAKFEKVGSVYKKKDESVWGWVIGAIVILMIIGAIVG